MKRVMYVVCGIGLMLGVASAQQPPAAGQKVGLATSIQRGYANIKLNLTQNAEKMPEADYGFKPGAMPLGSASEIQRTRTMKSVSLSVSSLSG